MPTATATSTPSISSTSTEESEVGALTATAHLENKKIQLHCPIPLKNIASQGDAQLPFGSPSFKAISAHIKKHKLTKKHCGDEEYIFTIRPENHPAIEAEYSRDSDGVELISLRYKKTADMNLR